MVSILQNSSYNHLKRTVGSVHATFGPQFLRSIYSIFQWKIFDKNQYSLPICYRFKIRSSYMPNIYHFRENAKNLGLGNYVVLVPGIGLLLLLHSGIRSRTCYRGSGVSLLRTAPFKCICILLSNQVAEGCRLPIRRALE